MKEVTADDIYWLLNRMRRLDAEPVAERWQDFTPDHWPALFRVIALGADLPRLAGQRALAEFPTELWPDMALAMKDVIRIQDLLDHPAVPKTAIEAPVYSLDSLDEAATDLQESHTIHFDFLFAAEPARQIEALARQAGAERRETWGQLERAAAPELFALFDEALSGEAFRRLTGFDVDRDEYTLTLSLQDLAPEGIGWHRDLYWPKEWVGRDVFPVLYALDSDSPVKGGAFLHYVPWRNHLYVCHRQKFHTTVMWNSADNAGRLLHAVSGFHGADTSRHLLILQCLRRAASD